MMHNPYTSIEDHNNIMQFKDFSSRSCDEIYMCPLNTSPVTCSWQNPIHQHFRLHRKSCQGLKGFCTVPNCRCIMHPFLTGHCCQDELNVPGPTMEALLKKSKQIANWSTCSGHFSTVFNPMCTNVDSMNEGHQQSPEEGIHSGLKTKDRHSSQKLSGGTIECRCGELHFKEQDVISSQENILKDEAVSQQCVDRKAGKQQLEETSVIVKPSTKCHHQSCISSCTQYFISGLPQKLSYPAEYHMSDNDTITNKENKHQYVTEESNYLSAKSVKEETCKGVNQAQILNYNDCCRTKYRMEINLNTETVDKGKTNGMTYSPLEKKDEFIYYHEVETKNMDEQRLPSEKTCFSNTIQPEVTECNIPTQTLQLTNVRLPMKNIDIDKNHYENHEECEKSIPIQQRERGNSNQDGSERTTPERTPTESSQTSSAILDNGTIPEDYEVFSEISILSDIADRNLQVKGVIGDAKLGNVIAVNIKNGRKEYISNKETTKDENKFELVLETNSKEGTLNEESESEDGEDETILKELLTGELKLTEIKTAETEFVMQRWIADMEMPCQNELECKEMDREGDNDNQIDNKEEDGTESSENEIINIMTVRQEEYNDGTSNKGTDEEDVETAGEYKIAGIDEKQLVTHLDKFKKTIGKEFKSPSAEETRNFKEKDLHVDQVAEEGNEIDEEQEEADEEPGKVSDGDKSLSVDQESDDSPEDSEENTDFWGSKDDLSISLGEEEQDDNPSQNGDELSQIDDKKDFCMSNEESARLQESGLIACSSQEALAQDEQTDIENKRPMWLCCLSSCPLPEFFKKRKHEALEKKCSEDFTMVGLQMSPLETGSLIPTKEPAEASPTSNAEREHVSKTSCEDSREDTSESNNESKPHSDSDSEDNVHDFFD